MSNGFLDYGTFRAQQLAAGVKPGNISKNYGYYQQQHAAWEAGHASNPAPAPEPAPAPAAPAPAPPEPARDLNPAATSFQKSGSYVSDSQATADDRRTSMTVPRFMADLSQRVAAPSYSSGSSGGYFSRAMADATSDSGLGSFGGTANPAGTARTRDQSYGGHWRQDRADRNSRRMAGDQETIEEIRRRDNEIRLLR